MANDSALANLTGRRQRLDRTLERIERMRFAVLNNVKTLVVVVVTGFALAHRCVPCKKVELLG